MAWSRYPDGCYINLPHDMYQKAREKYFIHNHTITKPLKLTTLRTHKAAFHFSAHTKQLSS